MRPKLGQYILKDKKILARLINSYPIYSAVVEVGAGEGNITQALINHGYKKIYAVELDPILVLKLKEKFLKYYPVVEIIESDILKFIPKEEVVLVGNIPYYISTQLLEYLVKLRNLIKLSIITLQREFALRLIASPQNYKQFYSYLSVFIQHYADVKILFFIPRGAFAPVPKVDSAVLKISWKEEREELFTQFLPFIRYAFREGGKMLVNIIHKYFGYYDKYKLIDALKKEKIIPQIRPKKIDLNTWYKIVKLLLNFNFLPQRINVSSDTKSKKSKSNYWR